MADSTLKPCPFCVLPEERIVMPTGLAIAIREGLPVSPGRTLIIPKRPVAIVFDTTTERRSTEHDA